MLIETERLILRPTQLVDFDRWAELQADPVASQHLGGPQPRASSWRGFMTMAGAWSLTGVAMFSLIERDSGLWVGRAGPWHPEAWPGTEIGWSLHPAAWGRGYATEAATAAIDYAFDVLGWERVIHCIAPDNLPSQRVAERLGSQPVGPTTLPPPFEASPVEMWAQSRTAWRARRA